MLNRIIPLFSSYLNSGIYEYVLVYLVPLAFLASLPFIVNSFFKR